MSGRITACDGHRFNQSRVKLMSAISLMLTSQ